MSTQVGLAAEANAAEYLVREGYKILQQNWKTRWCEIDIVAKKDTTVYFVEVKYRRRTDWGDGLDAITEVKLKQMRRSAELWIYDHLWDGKVELSVMSLSGQPPAVDQFLEQLQ